MALHLGLDLGSLATGVAIIDSNRKVVLSGTIKVKRNQDFDIRCYQMAEDLIAIMNEHQGIEHAYIEDIFYGQNHKTLAKLAQVRGSISAAIIGQLGIVPIYYQPSVIKKTISIGGGSASKDDVQRMVKLITGVEARSTDESDAIAVALTGFTLKVLRGGTDENH